MTDLPSQVRLAHTVVAEPPVAAGPSWSDRARALWPHRGRLVAGAASGALLGLLLALVLPRTYTATATLLEAPRGGGGSALDQLSLSAEALGLPSRGSSSNALTYPDILRSRRLLGALLEESFPDARGESRPLRVWLVRGTATPQRTERALDALREQLDISLDRRTNLLRVGVRDSDPVRAAAVANAACAQLQHVLVHSMTTQAGAQRRFIEERLTEARRRLARAEESLRAFRESNLRGSNPRLALETSRLMREARTQEEIVLALTRQHELARVDEQRDVPVLNVLDAAAVPAFASAPRRSLLVAGGLLLGLFAAAIVAWPRRGAESVSATSGESREAA